MTEPAYLTTQYLPRPEADRRAADIDVIQNGIWLTALLGLDNASIKRSLARGEQIPVQDHSA